MFDKLFEAQQKAEEIKKRLHTIQVSGEAEGGLIKVTATGNKDILDIQIDPVFLSNAEKDELEELLVVAVNNALKNADNTSQSELQSVTRDMLGGLGGMFGK